MSITAVPNSPIIWSDAAQSALQPKDSRYCQPWGTNPAGVTPVMDFQLQFGKVSVDILGGTALTPYYTGVITTVGSNQIIDSLASFATPPAQSQHIAVNTTTGEQTSLDAPPVAGLTALDINDDIFDSGTLGDGYAVVALRLPIGNILYNGTNETVAFSPFVSENSFIIEDFFPNTTNRFVVEIDVEDYAGGELTVLAGSYPSTFTTFDQAQPIATSNGTWSFYGIPSGADLKIQDSSQESSYTITGIRVYYVARPEVQIYESEAFIETLDPDQYIHNRALFAKPFTDTPAGCYAYYANNFNGLDGRVNFPIQTTDIWSLDPRWAFVANELVHTAGPGTSESATRLFSEPLDARCNYVIYFRLAAGSDLPQVFINAVGVGVVDVSAYIQAGTNYINIYGYAIDIIAIVSPEVDNVTIEQFNIYNTFYNDPGGYFSPDLTEEVLARRIAPNFCTLSANVCVQDNLSSHYVLYESSITNDCVSAVKKKDRWLPASTTYTERLYLNSNVRFARYQDDDFEAFRDASGRNQIVSTDRVKVQECQIAPVPVGVHDWMTWAIRNQFEVNGVEYYPIEGSYSPNWQRDSPNASAVFEIAEQDQDIK